MGQCGFASPVKDCAIYFPCIAYAVLSPTRHHGGNMFIHDHEIKFTPNKLFTDLTPKIEAWLETIDVWDGVLFVQSKHTTACVKLLEHEPFLEKDTRDAMKRLFPDGYHNHDDIELRDVDCPCERQNGASHLRSLLFSAGETLFVSGGKLDKGVWQSVMFVELDGNPRRKRTVQLRLMK